ncbi:MAG: cryptochrome/photolyase family protein [Dehalococcoidia bacterium]
MARGRRGQRQPAAVLTAVVWFRRDLRIHDNPALAASLAAGGRQALFVLDSRLRSGRWASERRNRFLEASLEVLGRTLAACGVRLSVVEGRPEEEVPRFAAAQQAASVHVSWDVTAFARQRDAAVAAALDRRGCQLVAHDGLLLHTPARLLAAKGGPCRTFASFLRRLQEVPMRSPVAPPAGAAEPTSRPGPAEGVGLAPGEWAARVRLAAFVRWNVASYAEDRDRLDREGTARISQDLKFGLLSPRDVLAACGAGTKFAAELAWREYAHYTAWHFPELAERALVPSRADLPWRSSPEDFNRWCAGETGFDLVDAGMKELVASGFMPNRARMVAASFLSKQLLIDWRKGHAWFMRQLLDGDVASNALNWQWCASTGVDAAPYFRLFSPERQAQRFDPDGAYRRLWLGAGPRPSPMVDLAEARRRALAAFRGR